MVRKKPIIQVEPYKIKSDFYKVYVYKKPSKLFLMPIPYKWKLDLTKIAEIKNPPKIDGVFVISKIITYQVE
jgi:hypothetical protein